MWTNLVFAAVLSAIGIGGYLGTARVSVTALIPAMFGLFVALFSLLGWLSPGLGSFMHYATICLAVLGFLATARSLSVLPKWLGRQGTTKPAALAKGLMSVVCLLFVGVAVLGN